MRCVVQRVSSAAVHVDGIEVGSIDQGLLVLVGFGRDDDEPVVEPMLNKLLKLRIFADEEGKMKHNVVDVNAKMLLVSQFTLYGSLKRDIVQVLLRHAHQIQPGGFMMPFSPKPKLCILV